MIIGRDPWLFENAESGHVLQRQLTLVVTWPWLMNEREGSRIYLFSLQFVHHLALRICTNYMKNFCVALIAGKLVLPGSVSRADFHETSSPTPAATNRGGSHDFDFLIGEWRAHQ